MTTLLRGGRLVDPSSGIDAVGDILLDGGAIAAVGARLDVVPARTIDVSGLVVIPGLIDMHVHLREPGFEAKETIATGARAAARGGFTTVCAMPNTRPVNDCPAVTESVLAAARRAGLGHVLPIASVTRGERGEELVDMAALKAAGAAAFSDDGLPVADSGLMRRALNEAEAIGALVIDHCEDRTLTRGGALHEGRASARLGLPGIPAAAEDIPVARDIILGEALKARVHIAHLSTRGGARLVAEAKSRGVRISAETTPHHLLLSDEALETADPNLKMNPPLRAAEDVAALAEALRSGVIDVIATDHAPHTEDEKRRPFVEAPFGIVGLETAVPLILDRFVRPGLLTLGRFVELMSLNPARLLGLGRKGRLAAGADADLTVLDLGRKVAVDKSKFESKGRNTPFDGWRLTGDVVMTIASGRVIYPFGGAAPAGRP